MKYTFHFVPQFYMKKFSRIRKHNTVKIRRRYSYSSGFRWFDVFDAKVNSCTVLKNHKMSIEITKLYSRK